MCLAVGFTQWHRYSSLLLGVDGCHVPDYVGPTPKGLALSANSPGANSQKGHNKQNRTTYLTAKVCIDIMTVGIIRNSSGYYVVSKSGISKKLWASWAKITHF